jgi:hypothetical protein
MLVCYQKNQRMIVKNSLHAHVFGLMEFCKIYSKLSSTYLNSEYQISLIGIQEKPFNYDVIEQIQD